MPLTAFLTIGSGPIAVSVFEALKECSALNCVIFSRKTKKSSIWQKVINFGLWYTFQQIYMNVQCLISGAKIDHENAGVPNEFWRSKKDEERLLSWLLERKVEVILVCGFHHKISPLFASSFKACVNIHPSLLPAYRGPEPLTWALIEQTERVGITLHYIDNDIDTGDILLQESIKREKTKTLYGLEDRLAEIIKPMVKHFHVSFVEGKLHRLKQTKSLYYPAPSLKVRQKIMKQQ